MSQEVQFRNQDERILRLLQPRSGPTFTVDLCSSKQINLLHDLSLSSSDAITVRGVFYASVMDLICLNPLLLQNCSNRSVHAILRSPQGSLGCVTLASRTSEKLWKVNLLPGNPYFPERIPQPSESHRARIVISQRTNFCRTQHSLSKNHTARTLFLNAKNGQN